MQLRLINEEDRLIREAQRAKAERCSQIGAYAFPAEYYRDHISADCRI